MMRKNFIGFIGVGAAAILAGAMAGNLASRQSKTAETATVRQGNEVNQTNRSATDQQQTQTQPIINRRLGSSSSLTARRKPYPASIRQKYSKHTNRLRCKHNAKLKRRKSA